MVFFLQNSAFFCQGFATPHSQLIAAGTSWRELLQDLELRLDLDLGSEDDSEDREYVRGLFEAEYAEAMSYEGHD